MLSYARVIVPAAIGLCLVAGTRTHAQAIHGTLLERVTSVPIEGVEVTLMRAGGAELVKARTDSVGKFAIVAPRPGEYALRVRRLGFEPVSTSLFSIDSGVTITPTLELVPVPRRLNTLRIVAAGMPPLDWTRGFEERRRRGIGYFVTRSDIERHVATAATDALRGVPGIAITPVTGSSFGAQSWVVASTRGDRSMSGMCLAALYVDGMKVDDLNETIRPADMESAEVYASSHGVPPGFRADTCGTVIVWTRATAAIGKRDTRSVDPSRAVVP